MGVVHKLTDEVIDFIVAAKTADAKLSCRKLSDLVKEKFDVDVSKSSVNNILKDANLSSSVGRRSKKSDEKQFKIPDQKKSQLFAEMQKLKSKPTQQIPPSSPKTEILPKKKKPFPQKKQTPVKPPSEEYQEKPKERKEIIENLGEYSDKIKRQRNAFFANFSETYEHMGGVILKCIEWSISDKPALPGILKKITEYYPINNDEGYVESILNSFLLPNANGKRQLGLDAISEINTQAVRDSDFKSRREWADVVNISKRSSLAVANAFHQQFTRISGYTVTYESGEEIFIDVDFKRLHRTSPGTKKTAYLDKAMAYVSDCLISNRKTPCFFGFNSDVDTDDMMAEYLRLFLQYDDAKISKVGFLDLNGHELTEIKHIPAFKRAFTLGIWPESSLYNKATKGLKWTGKERIYVPEIDKVLYYAESVEHIDDCIKVRKVSVWTCQDGDPDVVIVLNDCNSISYVIKKFVVTHVQRFLDINRDAYQDEEEVLADFSVNQEITTVGRAFELFAKAIQVIAKDKFDINQSFSDVYEKCGRFFVSPHAIIVHLDELSDQNVQLMNKINMNSFFSFSGRKILIFSSQNS